MKTQPLHLNSLIETAMDGIVVTDENQIITIFNSAAEKMFGYAAVDIIGQALEVLMPARYHATHRQQLENFSRTGVTSRALNIPGVVKGLHANGEELFLEASISAVSVSGKKIYTAILRDISARLQLEKKCAKSRWLLSAIAATQVQFISESMHKETFASLLAILLDYSASEYGFIAEVLHDAQGAPYLKTHALSNIAWNEATQALYEKHHVQGMEFRNLNTLFGAVLTTGQPVVSNNPAQDPRAGGVPQGHPEMHAFLGWPLYDASGMIGMLGIANRAGGYELQFIDELNTFTATCASMIASWRLDTQRRQAEAALKQNEERLQLAELVYQANQEAIMVTDEKNAIVDVNPAFTRITGYELDEIRGKNPRIFQSGKHGPAFYQEMWRSIRDEGYWQGEMWDKRRDGELHAKWISISVIRDKDGGVFRHVAQFSDITDKKRKDELIWTQANFDALTGLPNRFLLADRMYQATSSAMRNNAYGALLSLDLDHFKQLNDTFGHNMGDTLLIEVARRLQGCIREEDTVARMGGDEFLVVLNDLNGDVKAAALQAELVAEKIRNALCRVYHLDKTDYYSSSSVGIVLFSGHSISHDELLAHVDAAMYQAKAKGRNAICFFDASMQEVLEKRNQLDTALRGALERGEFKLHYQLQVNNQGRPVGAEALLRWEHPQLGMVSPVTFIPVAEESGMILPIGLWVLETACTQLALWQQQSELRELEIAVNVSSRQFREPDFLAQVSAVLEKTGIRPNMLKLELTESMVLDDIEESIKKMHEFKRLGLKFAMDDFGTGYSSLSYLTRLPVDQLKIDQSFVRNVSTDRSDATIVQTIIAMGRSLELDVIAEGVETQAQREFLAQHGCSTYQGYLFARPLPVDAFEKKVAEWGSAADSNAAS